MSELKPKLKSSDFEVISCSHHCSEGSEMACISECQKERWLKKNRRRELARLLDTQEKILVILWEQ